MKKIVALPALAGAFALTLAGCAQAPGTDASGSASVTTTTTTTAAPSSTTTATATETASPVSTDSPATGTPDATGAPVPNAKACMVSDEGGFNDKSFNETAHNGMVKAVQEFGLQTAEVESNDTKDFDKNVQSMVDAKCNIIVTVGFKLGDATVAAAKANPNVKFAIVDWADPKGTVLPNLKYLTYNTAQSSFMAGYLAASQSKTGTVGTWGGIKIPTVTIFMDGFAQGVQYFNQAKGKTVKVVGWDATKQDGQFLGNFGDVAGGKRISTQLTNQGADVILPVAGPAGEGALQVAQDSNGKVNAIWVDTDGCVSSAKYCKSIMSSVAKGMDVSVYDAIKSVKDGAFDSKPYVGTLDNGGTGLSPFHDFDSVISAETKSELDKIKADITSGAIKIESAAQPK